MEIVDLNAFPRNDMLTYGGTAGAKFAVLLDGEPWLLKFPRRAKNFKESCLLPYSTGPISEYIGSKIYESLNIPVHETMLGYRDGKIIVACKDFTADAELHEFKSIKNTLPDTLFGNPGGSSEHGEYLADALTTIDNASLFKRINGMEERFWDMFVTDAFLRNGNRDNGSWGVLTAHGEISLAPIFGNGNSLFGNLIPSAMSVSADSAAALESNLPTDTTFFLDENGEHIHPFGYIASRKNLDCNAALIRFLDHLNPEKIRNIIDEIPNRAFGLDVISSGQKDFYIRLLRAAYRNKLLPIGETLGWGTCSPST